MKLTIDLSPAQAERLRQEAERLGLAPEELARANFYGLMFSNPGAPAGPFSLMPVIGLSRPN